MIGQQRTARSGTIEQYIATFDEVERRELTVATVALVVADALGRARRRAGRAAVVAPVSTDEIDPQLLRAYLHELGHNVRVVPTITPEGQRLKAIPRRIGVPRYRHKDVYRNAPVTWQEAGG